MPYTTTTTPSPEDTIPRTFIIRLVLPLDRVSSLLCCAWEGGSNYWVSCTSSNPPPAADDRELVTTTWENALYPGGSCRLEIPSHLDYSPASHTLDWSSIASGLSALSDQYPRHFADFLAGQEDATTGDVFLQCCLFGRVIFG